jgi:hypothetical protein
MDMLNQSTVGGFRAAVLRIFSEEAGIREKDALRKYYGPLEEAPDAATA